MKKYKNDVYITGVGVVSPVGTQIEEFHQALYSDKQKDMWLDEKNFIVGEMARKKLLDYCCKAIENAIIDWGGNISSYEKVTVIVGSGLGYTDCWSKNTAAEHIFLSGLIEDIRMKLSFRTDVIYFANSCCASSQAIAYGADMIGYGFKELVIVGGVDIYSDIARAGFKRLNALDESGCKPFRENRRGISIGEGAAFFVLQKSAISKYGYICGYGLTSDALDIVRMDEKGTYIQKAVEQALLMAGITCQNIDLIVAHGTGTVQNDRIESMVISNIFSKSNSLPVIVAPKAVIGHTGGASGAFGLLTAIVIGKFSIASESLCTQSNSSECEGSFFMVVDKPLYSCNYAIINCFAFGGTNCVIVWKGDHD